MGAHYANTLAAANEPLHRPTWVLALDDLRYFEALFDSPAVFVHFAEMRLRAAGESAVEVHDEMDHLGLYFRENDYIEQTLDFDGKMGRFGYTTDIDRYFFALAAGEPATRPQQKVSLSLKQLIAAADRTSVTPTLLTSLVLHGDHEARSQIAMWLDQQRADPAIAGRFRLFFLMFDARMLFLSVARDWSPEELERVFDEVKARLLKSAKGESCIVAFLLVSPETIVIADCRECWKKDITASEISRLAPISRDQFVRDFSGLPSKIGRNEPCPCGSGLKYKRCCLVRRERH